MTRVLPATLTVSVPKPGLEGCELRLQGPDLGHQGLHSDVGREVVGVIGGHGKMW